MTNAAKRNILLGQLVEGSATYEILGFVTWWSLRNVSVTQEQFAQMLKDVGLSDKWAKEHNYRSAFTRALRNMEERRIIRTVEEDNKKLLCQFTAELKEGVELQYNKETTIKIDKDIYRDSKSFEQALTEGSEEIKKKIIEFFYIEKKRYSSSDVTRYIQNILNDKADIISLRDNGSVYFVPAGFTQVMDAVTSLVNGLGGGSTMENFPVPNVSSSRKMVRNYFLDEVTNIQEQLEKQYEEIVNGNKDVTSKWTETRTSKIRDILARIENYGSVLNPDDSTKLKTNFEALNEKIGQFGRKLQLEEVS